MKRLLLVLAMTVLPAAFVAAAPQGLGPFATFRDPIVGHRLMGLVFDLSMLPGNDLTRAVNTAADYVVTWMSPRDLVSVSVLGEHLDTLQDFTADRAALVQALDRVAGLSRDAGPSDDRFGDLTTLCQGLGALQRDSLVRFNAGRIQLDEVVEQMNVIDFSSGVMRGVEDPTELGAVAVACGQQHVVFYTIDARTAAH